MDVQVKTLFGTRVESVSYPIKILHKEDGSSEDTKSPIKKNESFRLNFPKAFDPLLMPGAHYVL